MSDKVEYTKITTEVDKDLYKELRSLLITKDITFKEWLDGKVREELGVN